TVRVRKPKQEPGSTATPHMPSSSEVTTADWPSYIGQYTNFTKTDSTNPSDYTWSLIRGNDGKDGARGKDGISGKDGVGIKTTVITYAISTNGNTAPATDWTSQVPTLVKGQYLWTKTVWTYTDSSSETGYSVTYIAKDGNNGNDGIAGKDGTGIRTTTITYAGSTSGTTAPSSGWTTRVPTVPAGQFLWTKTLWTYTDKTSETGYSVAMMGVKGDRGNDGVRGKDGPAGSNGDPGKVVSDTEPTTKFKGLTWKYSGITAINASDGTNIQPNTEYYWNGNNWVINLINAHNINVDDLSAISTTLTNGKFISNWSSSNATGTTTIEKNHLIINSANASLNTNNTIALDNEQGMMMTYTDTTSNRTVTAGVNFQGFFVTDSAGPYVSVTPTGIVNSVDVSWTTIGSYAAYRRDGKVVTIRVVGAKTSATGDIYIGKIPLKDCPTASVMGTALAWSASVANDKHIQINGLNQRNSGTVTILSAAANQEYTFQFTYQI
ncbi:collagen-like triple helix repeat-containing protein, partial [Lactococcus lactis]|uniref:collagen-like triple helix repeat-containing protein n=1 Tax=Lactococcus lactis TaxID=1358 RepID=UPI00223B1250